MVGINDNGSRHGQGHGHGHHHRRQDTTASTSSSHHSKQSKKDHQHSKHKSDTNTNKEREGLRIFVGTANLGHALPDADSVSAWLPHHGRTRNILNSHVKSSSITQYASKGDHWNGVNTHGKIEIIAIGMQEAVPGSNAFTATGLTSKLTGTKIKKEPKNAFSKALGDLGKPIDDLGKNFNDMIATGVKNAHAELGGIVKLKSNQ